jgi:hypothetical protein
MGHAWLIETEGEKIETQPSYKVEHYGFLNLRKRKVKREPICGYNWIQDGCLHYIDEFGDERRIGPDCKPKVTVVRE